MNRPLTNTEFFTFEGEVWFRMSGEHVQLTEKHSDIIDGMIDIISTFYHKAYEALCKHYNGSAANRRYYRFRIVSRFIRCNFAQLDDVSDINETGHCNFEFVPCPLRGECLLDRVVCRPEFDHKLSSAEYPVLRLWYKGCSVDEIADQLCLSPHTIHNHIRHAYERTNTHSRSEFAKYATRNNLFS